MPVISGHELARWSSEQAKLLPALKNDPKFLSYAALVIREWGGHTGPLPILLRDSGWASFDQIAVDKQLPTELKIRVAAVPLGEVVDEIQIPPNTLHLTVHSPGTNYRGLGVVALCRDDLIKNKELCWAAYCNGLAGAAVEAVAAAWQCSVEDMLRCSLYPEKIHFPFHRTVLRKP